MVYNVEVKWLSFRQDLSNKVRVLNDQQATYAVLKYAQDVPQDTQMACLEFLKKHTGQITDRKLRRLVEEYIRASGAGLIFEPEEFVETIEIPVEQTFPNYDQYLE